MTPPSELSATWSRITGALQTIMSPEVYGLWFPKFSLLEDSGKALTLVCDDPMAALWVENSYTPELKQAAMLALGTERQIKFICTDEVASMPAAKGFLPGQNAADGGFPGRTGKKTAHTGRQGMPE